jgi:hypothetical protein
VGKACASGAIAAQNCLTDAVDVDQDRASRATFRRAASFPFWAPPKRYAIRDRLAPSGVIHNCNPPPSESFMIFGPGLAPLIAKSFDGMLVSIGVGIEAYQRIYQRFCSMQADAFKPF